MVGFMEAIRDKRLEREHKELVFVRKGMSVSILRTYKNSSVGFPYTTILPSLPDFYEFAPVKAILELPSEVVVDTKSFDDVVPQLPSLCQEWRERIHDQFLRVAGHPHPLSLTSSEEKIEWVELAWNVFICKGSWHRGHQKMLFCPGVLSHVCCTVQECVRVDNSWTEPYDENVKCAARDYFSENAPDYLWH